MKKVLALFLIALSTASFADGKKTTTTTTTTTFYPSCDSIYFSPVTFSHHWQEPETLKLRAPPEGWQEVNASIAFDCKIQGGATIGAGVMKNSFDLGMRYIGASLGWKLSEWFSVQAGVMAGDYEQPTWRHKRAWHEGAPTITRTFVSPILALTIAESKFMAVDLSHSLDGLSGGGRGEHVPVTMARVRFKVM
jgi:hypothetical protein